jgi:hypothetical protein
MFIAKKRFSHNWQLQASYTRSDSVGIVTDSAGNTVGTGAEVGTATGLWTNPNYKINAYGPGIYAAPDQFVFSGTYRIPYFGGLNFSANYRYATGAPWSRTAVIAGLAQGNQTVRLAPRGDQRTPALNMLDLRLEKTFSLGGSRSVGVYCDIFNTLNKGYATAMTEASGATFGVPSGWQSARQFQAGARFTF